MGEVENTTSQPLGGVEIVASFYDADGAFIGSDFTFTEVRTVNPGELVPFSLLSMDVESFDTYELQTQARAADEPRPDAFTLNNVSLQEGQFGWVLQGQVTNDADVPMSGVQISASATVAGARIVGVDFTFAELRTLQPGQTSPFELSFSRMLDDPTDYRVWVEGRPED